MQPAVILQPTDDGKLQLSVGEGIKGFVTCVTVNNSPFGHRSLTLYVSDPETQREETIVLPYIIYQ